MRVKKTKQHNSSFYVCNITIITTSTLLSACDATRDYHTSNETLPAIASPYPPTATVTNVTMPVTSVVSNLPNTILPASKTVSVDWQYRWLTGTPCYLPCWEGIKIGQTKASEALDLLRQNNIVKNVTQDTSSTNSNESWIKWEWFNTLSRQGYRGSGGEAYYNNKDSIINSINAPYGSKYKLSEIIQVYGNPSHVLALTTLGENGQTYSASLIFLSKGISIRVVSNNQKAKPVFSAEMLLEYPVFFIPSIEVYDAISGLSSAFLAPWQGYKSFDYYCRDHYASGKEDCSKINYGSTP